MHAEIISIGDEMTTGQRLDTNSQWLSLQLGDLGIRTLYHTTVGDDLAANVRVFQTAAQRADIIVATGGLGPTADDLTRQALADTLGVPLVQDAGALEHLKALFARRQRPMPERNLIQSVFPQGSRVIPNPHGSAPGIDLDLPRADGSQARVFSLPGVPAEMKEMWAQTVAPAIRMQLGEHAQTIVHRVIRCFGVGESDLEAMMPDLIARTHMPIVGITVSQATISLRITAEGRNREEALASMEPTVAVIRGCLGNLIFGEGEDEPQHAVLRLLAERKQTLATCECGSGGRMADWLSEASINFPGVYVGGEVIRDWTEESTAAIERMAEHCRLTYGCDYVVAVGPFPPLANKGEASNHVRIALAKHDGVLARSAVFAGHPDILKDRTIKQALNFLRLHLIGAD